MAIIAFAARKGGAGSTTTSLALALGLSLREEPVEWVQVVSGDLLPAFAADAPLPFRCTLLETDPDWRDRLVARIDEARAAGRHLVIDLPAVTLKGWATLLARLDLVLVPVMPGPQAFLAAVETWAGARHTILGELSGRAKARPWLLPVGWTSPSRGVAEITGKLEVLRAMSGGLPHPAVVPWTVPRLLPGTLDLMFDPEALGHARAVRPVARRLAQAALRLADDPAAPLADEEALFAGLAGSDPHAPDPEDLPGRLAALAEDLARIEAGQGPDAAELAAAPVIEDWRLMPEPVQVLVGRVAGHPELKDGLKRTSVVFHLDAEESWARTLGRIYRLGRKAGEETLH